MNTKLIPPFSLQEGDEFMHFGHAYIAEEVTGVYVGDKLRARVLTTDGQTLYIKTDRYVEVTA